MSIEQPGQCKLSSGRTVTYRAKLRLGTKLGDRRRNGLCKILDIVVVAAAIDPLLSQIECAELEARVKNSYVVAGRSGWWAWIDLHARSVEVH